MRRLWEKDPQHAGFPGRPCSSIFKYGYLLFIALAPPPNRMTFSNGSPKNFEQPYTRFLDLPKAEAQV